MRRVLPEPVLNHYRMTFRIDIFKGRRLQSFKSLPVRAGALLLAALLPLSFMVSCAKMMDREPDLDFKYPLNVVISGIVYDRQTSQPLGDISVTLDVFMNVDDSQPIYTTSAISSYDGSYCISTSVMSPYLRLSTSGNMLYLPGTIYLNLSASGVHFDPETNEYIIEYQNFYLENTPVTGSDSQDGLQNPSIP